jgi:hypothetical protein
LCQSVKWVEKEMHVKKEEMEEAKKPEMAESKE